ncbi:MAG TPA: phosphate propanoyltransferase [Firmicutes bacterium]|uniref:Phosphate propanoyltransferase n=1 Tax=Capillibacterium thermochitinicola TaxID=2699427 RepID=A0A8J6I3H6_9FIRM|nr:phosphate propanoyltransferase [Capillibacterium thermochitinicola]MBA2133567.1 phosphate propanoyltransferase [Capillibacterium thermochitinicola]HHW11970.1 phosphate propanoyltransferase [Bacillota bacterium]
MSFKVPVGVSNRHVHLSQEDLEKLFGKGASLTVKKELSQPGQFAAEETVNLIGPKRSIPNVRILGPVRPQTQVEISLTDSFTLGIEAPVRDSGNLENTPGLIIEGPKGRIEIKEGVIIAQRHLHLHDTEAAEMGLKDQDYVQVKVDGPRALIFEQVLVRVGPKYKKDLHLDTDEANAAGLKNGDLVTVIKP